ncbi:5-formyltetrahydrofolate cyclo-ligase [Candidatus Gottesmanbacteria bacterium]|nr:5-formyltetrahydrofolate cyclo-ligase [Candidatus Gottesmanbacteria bacterium]
MDDISAEKELLRKKFLGIRNGLSDRDKLNAAICQKLIKLPQLARVRTICVFFSLEGEVDIRPFISTLFRLGKIVLALKVKNKRELEIRKLTSLSELVIGVYRVQEPADTCEVVPKKSVDLFLVPGICFDRHGYRIGWGKGYYDRLLADVATDKIGVAYRAQVVADVPHTSYDVRMSAVVTEKKVIRPKKGEQT